MWSIRWWVIGWKNSGLKYLASTNPSIHIRLDNNTFMSYRFCVLLIPVDSLRNTILAAPPPTCNRILLYSEDGGSMFTWNVRSFHYATWYYIWKDSNLHNCKDNLGSQINVKFTNYNPDNSWQPLAYVAESKVEEWGKGRLWPQIRYQKVAAVTMKLRSLG